jgi:PAS domain-containing protein
VTAAGQIRWLSWNCRGLLGPDGRFAEAVGVGRDVTERPAGRGRPLPGEGARPGHLASIGDGVIRTDAGGRVDYLNPVAEQLTGWSLAEA